MAAEQVPYELEEPLLLALTSSQYRWLEQAHAVLRRLGLSVEPFGKDTMLVRTVPATFEKVLQPGNVSEAIQEAIRRTPAAATAEIWQEHLAAALACRSAYRAGDPLSESQIATLVAAVTQPHLAYTCPHGRPTYVTLSLSELERRFLRLASPLP
jgi:DNA mismatch repair protein MutL